jgi:hypothetical protein
MSLADLFARQKYAVWRSCVNTPELSLLYRYACKRAELGTMKLDDTSTGALSAPGDGFMDGLPIDMLPIAEQLSRAKLFPTFSYFRVYHRGDILERHIDRPACEISLTLCLGYEAERPWPIVVEGPAGTASIGLLPGDGVFYRGIECSHWREPFDGERVAQVFLNSVDQNGPYAEWKYDKRPALAFKRPRTPFDVPEREVHSD